MEHGLHGIRLTKKMKKMIRIKMRVLVFPNPILTKKAMIAIQIVRLKKKILMMIAVGKNKI